MRVPLWLKDIGKILSRAIVALGLGATGSSGGTAILAPLSRILPMSFSQRGRLYK